jgi:hypothetical protein
MNTLSPSFGPTAAEDEIIRLGEGLGIGQYRGGRGDLRLPEEGVGPFDLRFSLVELKPDYLILRRRGTKAETLPADEDDLLQPGDVVRVQPPSIFASVSLSLIRVSADSSRAVLRR